MSLQLLSVKRTLFVESLSDKWTRTALATTYSTWSLKCSCIYPSLHCRSRCAITIMSAQWLRCFTESTILLLHDFMTILPDSYWNILGLKYLAREYSSPDFGICGIHFLFFTEHGNFKKTVRTGYIPFRPGTPNYPRSGIVWNWPQQFSSISQWHSIK